MPSFKLYFCCAIVLFFVACQTPENYSTDPEVISEGERLFEQQCSACHSFQRSGIGPALGGVTSDTTMDWLREFVKNPERMIEQGDVRAVRLHEGYRTVMPSFQHLESKEIDAILSFMNIYLDKPALSSSRDFGDPVEDPIIDTVPMSGLVLQLDQVAVAPPTAERSPLARINKMIPMPGSSGRLFVSDLNGVLYEMEKENLHPFLTISDYFDHFINSPGLGSGLGSFAFHPDFDKNGLFYTNHTERPETSAPADFTFHDSIPRKVRWVLTEWKTAEPSQSVFSGTHRELMRVDMITPIHGMQEISFNTSVSAGDDDYGMLYIGIGDGGAAGEGYSYVTHSKNRIWGNIIRIDPKGNNSSNGQYGIPATNPFVNQIDGKALGEIFAMGFRNPHRILWDKDGRMFASDIGHNQIEELNLIISGHDYGWPEREGTFLFDKAGDQNQVYALPQNDAAFGYTYPVLQFDHDASAAISSGFVYEGSQIPELQRKYVFGGIANGRLFYADADQLKIGSQAPFYEFQVRHGNGPVTTLRRMIGDRKRIDLRFGYDHQNEMYVFTKYDGKIYKVVGGEMK